MEPFNEALVTWVPGVELINLQYMISTCFHRHRMNVRILHDSRSNNHYVIRFIYSTDLQICRRWNAYFCTLLLHQTSGIIYGLCKKWLWPSRIHLSRADYFDFVFCNSFIMWTFGDWIKNCKHIFIDRNPRDAVNSISMHFIVAVHPLLASK